MGANTGNGRPLGPRPAPSRSCDNSLYSFKGAPSARRARRPGREPREASAANRAGDERPSWPAAGVRGQSGGRAVGGAAAFVAPFGRKPTARRAAAPGGPSDRPRAVPAVSAPCRARLREPGRRARASCAVAGISPARGRNAAHCPGQLLQPPTVLRIPLRGTCLRRAVDPGDLCRPAGLTARARPKARPVARVANLVA